MHHANIVTLNFVLSTSSDPINFCGVHDSNLRCVERYTGSRIIPNKDGSLMIKGSSTEVFHTKKIMEQMLRLSEGRIVVTHSDIKLLSENLLNPSEEWCKNSLSGLDVSKYSKINARNVCQKEYINKILLHDLIFGIGPAGTGKTYLAVAAALHELKLGNFQRVVLTRPVVETDEHLGFLPGTLEEKIDPYIRPLYDAINDMISLKEFEKLSQNGQIELAPLAYMRGRTLSNSFIILDEAQNSTPNQMKMFLTRLGENSKMVITGDITQIDLKNRHSGLVEALNKLNNIKDIAIHKFDEKDVVRHGLVKKIIQAYENE